MLPKKVGRNLYLARVKQILKATGLLVAAALKKTFKILFAGSSEDAICQIGMREPYRDTQRDIDFSEYDIHGTMRTKCANALSGIPQDIFVPSPTEYAVWCPYSHPKVAKFTVKSKNKT